MILSDLPVFIRPDEPALVLAPMEGYVDTPMRSLLTEVGAYNYCVSEFIRVSEAPPHSSTFPKKIPELLNHGKTFITGIPVQVQILGGDAKKMALAALAAVQAGASAIDINFGCPSATVNNHDGGASILKSPHRIEEILTSVRHALPLKIPVSVKLRLGWENPEDIFENVERAQKSEVSWITIHARTKTQGYTPPAFWNYIGDVKKHSSIPIIANGEIWTLEDLKRCQEITRCHHFMIGRGALANPEISLAMSKELGIKAPTKDPFTWNKSFKRFEELSMQHSKNEKYVLTRLKQWLNVPYKRGTLNLFDKIRRLQTLKEAMECLA
jgi:tRNA-dihydrouridine synthase C